jgi:hypothetical protein
VGFETSKIPLERQQRGALQSYPVVAENGSYPVTITQKPTFRTVEQIRHDGAPEHGPAMSAIWNPETSNERPAWVDTRLRCPAGVNDSYATVALRNLPDHKRRTLLLLGG